MWLNKLTIAIVEKNPQSISSLIDSVPQFEDKVQIKEAMSLLKEANKLMHSLKDETQVSLIKIQQNRKFLKVTEDKKTSYFDIKS